MKQICVLFDLDGVIIDTESQYDIFWKKTGEDYHLGIKNFENKIKGTTLPNILNNFFSHLSAEEQEKIVKDNQKFETTMTFDEIPGAINFIHELKNNKIKIGLVTSSDDKKLKLVFEKLNFDGLFDTIVTADRITNGKPHPMCYLLAAKDLGVNPSDCFVFEDSFPGIQSGNDAGMKVIGLATTNPASSIQDKVMKVIPNFKEFTVENLKKLL